MDFQFTKKEEPVHYVLVATQQGQIIHQQTLNEISNGFIVTEVPDVHVKQEPHWSGNEVDSNESPPSTHFVGIKCEVPEIKPIVSNEHQPECKNSVSDSITAAKLNIVRSTKSTKKKSKSQAQSNSRGRNYKCDKCELTFINRSSQFNHTLRHEQSDIDQCKICKLFFPTSIIQFHTDSHAGPPYTCKICSKTFLIKRSWNHHRFTHENSNLIECDICGKRLKSKNSMLEHFKTHREREKNFSCELCQLNFFRKTSLTRHIKKLHGQLFDKCSNTLCTKRFIDRSSSESHKCRINQTIVPDRPSDETVAKELTDWNRYPCDKCKKTFYKLDRYVMHVAQNCSDQLMYECDYCSKLLSSKESLTKHFCYCRKAVELHKFDHKPCHVCNRLFSTEKKLETHINSMRCFFQTEEERAIDGFICDKCKKRFRNLDRLVLHVAQNCSEKIVYQCDYCSKVCVAKNRLLQHFAAQHKIDELKRESCHLCQKSFMIKARLRKHLKTVNHKNSPSFQCKYCNHIFSQRSGLNVHLKQCVSHELNKKYAEHLTESIGQNFEKFSCDICGCIFVQKAYIVEHMLVVHSKNDIQTKNGSSDRREMDKFSCSMCTKSFQKIYLLRRHIRRMHSDDRKRFVCDICNQKFLSEELYVKHRTVKRCRNKIQCAICSKMFAFKSGLVRHRKHCS